MMIKNMMGHKDRLINGLEHDVISGWRKVSAKLNNNPKLVKFAKRCINKRNRLAYKLQNKEHLKELNKAHIDIVYSCNYVDF